MIKQKQAGAVNYALAAMVLIGSLFAGGTASAQVYVFDTDPAYQAQSLSIVDSITFNGLPPTQSSILPLGNPGDFPVGGVTFTTNPGTNLLVGGPNAVGAQSTSYNFDGTSTLVAHGNTQNSSGPLTNGTVILDANLPSGTTAVGTQIASAFVGAPIAVTITLLNGTVDTYNLAAASAGAVADGLEFLGFVSPNSAITSISFTDKTADPTGSPTLALDNFTYGIADMNGTGPFQTVPEPSSVALAALGMGLLLVLRRHIAGILPRQAAVQRDLIARV